MKKSIVTLMLCSTLVLGCNVNAAIPTAGYSNISANPFICQFKQSGDSIAYKLDATKAKKFDVWVSLSNGSDTGWDIYKEAGLIADSDESIRDLYSYAYTDSKGRRIDVSSQKVSCSKEIPFQYSWNKNKTALKVKGKSTYSGKLTVKFIADSDVSKTICVKKGKTFIVTQKLSEPLYKIAMCTSKNKVEWHYNVSNTMFGSNLSTRTVFVQSAKELDTKNFHAKPTGEHADTGDYVVMIP